MSKTYGLEYWEDGGWPRNCIKMICEDGGGPSNHFITHADRVYVWNGLTTVSTPQDMVKDNNSNLPRYRGWFSILLVNKIAWKKLRIERRLSDSILNKDDFIKLLKIYKDEYTRMNTIQNYLDPGGTNLPSGITDSTIMMNGEVLNVQDDGTIVDSRGEDEITISGISTTWL